VSAKSSKKSEMNINESEKSKSIASSSKSRMSGSFRSKSQVV